MRPAKTAPARLCGALAASVLALALAGCAPPPGEAIPLSDSGHLTSDLDAMSEAGPAPGGGPAVISEAGGGAPAGGARLLGRSTGQPARELSLASAGPVNDGEAVRLNLVDAPIEEAAAVVIGDALGAAYAVEAGVAGTVTIRSDAALPKRALLAAFEAAIEGRGYSLSFANGVYRIGSARGRSPLAGDSQLFTLNYIAAAEVANALELAVPAENIRVVSGAGGGEAVIVTGSPDEIDLARSTIAALDVDALQGMSVMLVGLSHASAAEMATEIAALYGGDAAGGTLDSAGREPVGGLKIVPLDRLGAIMLLSRDAAALDRAFGWVSRLDRPRAADAERLFIYRVQNRPATSLAEALNALFANGPAPVAVAEGETAPPPAPNDPNVPRIVVDAERNALIISAPSRQFDNLVDMIRQLDSAPMQVLVEATILEVVLGDTLRYGVQFAFNSGELFRDRSSQTILTNGGALPIAPNLPGFAFSIGTALGPEVILEALDDVSDVRVVSSPKLLVRDGQPARLQVGDQVPIVTQSAQPTSSDGRIVNSVEYRDTGVQLTVTPRINSAGFVSLEIDQEVSSVTQTTSSGIDSPTISRRSLATNVTIKSGQTVVLGGLIQDRSTVGRAGIPVLQDTPLIGPAFGQRNQSGTRTELLALLRPFILTSPEQAGGLTEGLRRTFDGIVQSSGRTPTFRRLERTDLPRL